MGCHRLSFGESEFSPSLTGLAGSLVLVANIETITRNSIPCKGSLVFFWNRLQRFAADPKVETLGLRSFFSQSGTPPCCLSVFKLGLGQNVKSLFDHACPILACLGQGLVNCVFESDCAEPGSRGSERRLVNVNQMLCHAH